MSIKAEVLARWQKLPAWDGSAWQLPTPEKVNSIRMKLREIYGVPTMAIHHRAMDELILTVLSQSTNDRNRDVAFLRLHERFDNWQQVRDAPVEEVEAAIRPGGISNVKAKRIQEILRAVGEDLELDWLKEAPIEEARAFLCSLPGVGRKTAACVLLFAFGLHDVPVDTHVGRVGARLGLLPARGSTELLHDIMLFITPKGAELELHVNLLRHGRRTCIARRPRCGECALQGVCPSAFQWE